VAGLIVLYTMRFNLSIVAAVVVTAWAGGVGCAAEVSARSPDSGGGTRGE